MEPPLGPPLGAAGEAVERWLRVALGSGVGHMLGSDLDVDRVTGLVLDVEVADDRPLAAVEAELEAALDRNRPHRRRQLGEVPSPAGPRASSSADDSRTGFWSPPATSRWASQASTGSDCGPRSGMRAAAPKAPATGAAGRGGGSRDGRLSRADARAGAGPGPAPRRPILVCPAPATSEFGPGSGRRRGCR
jgi:hypothetical protein